MGDNNSEIEITYYEDYYKENNKDYPTIVKEYLDGFSERQEDFAKYGDPDSVNISFLNNCTYYSEISNYMNYRWGEEDRHVLCPYESSTKKTLDSSVDEREIIGEKWDEYERIQSTELQNKVTDDTKLALVIRDDKQKTPKPIMLLTSDQFGFSVGKKALTDNHHAYGIYYNKIKDDCENERVEKFKFIGKCVYDTRTLGGGFIWPVNMVWNNKKWKGTRTSLINGKRGKDNYEDRVDLMLWELKEFLDNKNEKSCISFALGRDIWMEDWLGLFDSFNRFVDFFMFHPFVVEKDGSYYPIDVFNSKIPEEVDIIGKTDGIKMEERKPCLRVIEKAPETKEIQQCNDCNKLKRMLNNVRLLTLARSRMMTAFIKCPNENDWEQYNPKWTENDLVKQKIAPSLKS